MRAMITHIADSLENFKEEEHWLPEHYDWLNEYLSDPNKKCLFFWSDFDNMNLRVSDV